jgi:hypothetical protein
MIPLNLAEVGGWGLFLGLVVFVLVSVAKGWLVPKTLHDQMLASTEARATVAEAAVDRLKDRADKLTETNNILAQATANTAAVGNTVEKLVEAIQSSARVAGGSQ